MRDYYAKRAPVYEDVYRRPERAGDLARLAQWLQEGCRGRYVLEVACGTGYWSRILAEVAASVVAGDLLEETLAEARSIAPANVAFRRFDALDLPADLGTYDAAFAGLWVSHVPYEALDGFFLGLRSHLEPGATVSLIDNTRAQLVDYPIVREDAHGNTYQERTLADGSKHEVLKNFPTTARLDRAIADFGRRTGSLELEHFWAYRYVIG